MQETLHVYRLCYILDDLTSYSSGKYKIKHQRRRRMRKVATRIRRCIRNLVDEVHCKLAKYLCETYHVILLPKFDTQRMVQRKTGYSRRIILYGR